MIDEKQQRSTPFGGPLTLVDCGEFRQTLLARPPRVVHGAVLLLTSLLAAAGGWAAWVQADLVVRARGRVRPSSAPVKVFRNARSEVPGAGLSGKVAAIHVKPGDSVKKGVVLLRLDTERVENELARRRQTIKTAEEELARLEHLEKLLENQLAAAKSRAEAELDQTEADVKQARQRQAADLQQAQADARAAADELARTRRLVALRAASPEELGKAQARDEGAKAALAKARLPVDEGKIRIARQALVVLEREAAVKREELSSKRVLKLGEVEAVRLELANLELEQREAVLLAPVDGVVTSGEVRVGDILEPGKPVLEIAEQGGFVFELLVPTDEMAHLRLGMPVRVKLDAYDFQRYGTLPGKVCYIAPDSTVDQSATAYLVKVALEAAEVRRGDLHGPVKLGMAGRAEILTDRRSLLSLLGKQIRQSISLE